SILSGAHNLLFPRVRELLDAQGMEDAVLFGGGIIPGEDAKALRAKGVGAVFTPGASLEEIVAYVRGAVEGRRAGKKG
ncbi:MAG: hypothetical protein HYU38_10315, partial [Candidatus Tectomicrobia bacterium]|nr:hypothetical protein [Candidatus Tectomicrobia bacterium]